MPSQAMSERVLCWLVNYSSETSIVSDDKSTNWPHIFNFQGSVSYQFLFPIMDLDEATQIQPVIIENAFMSPLLRVSRRYDADKLLLGQLHMIKGEWTLDWQLHDAKTDGVELIRGEAAGMPNQVAAQVVSALESYMQDRHSVSVENKDQQRQPGFVIADTIPPMLKIPSPF
jgi:Uncharacterized protein conserved in bacteria (DUF2066).